MLPIVAQLVQSGWRLGILSNTCEGHWEHCLGRYAILRECFSVYALSYRIGQSKPAAAIFRRRPAGRLPARARSSSPTTSPVTWRGPGRRPRRGRLYLAGPGGRRPAEPRRAAELLKREGQPTAARRMQELVPIDRVGEANPLRTNWENG